jgi:hypothetical protein
VLSLQTLLSMELPFEFAKVHIRFDGYTPLTPIKDLKSNLVGAHMHMSVVTMRIHQFMCSSLHVATFHIILTFHPSREVHRGPR